MTETAEKKVGTVPHRLKRYLDTLLPLVLVTLLVVLYLEFLVAHPPVPHAAIIRVEQAILVYFVLELAVDLWLYKDNHRFVTDRWLDIVLVLPFLSLFRGTLGLLRALKLVKPAKAAKAAKPVKAVKAAKTGKALKLGRFRRVRRALKPVKVSQKLGKAATKARHLLEE